MYTIENTMQEKRCSRCKEWKALSEFHKNRGYRDNYDAYCKKCRRVYHRKYRQEHPEYRAKCKTRYESKKIPCPQCGNLMWYSSSLCVQCSNKIQGKRLGESSKRWWTNDPNGNKRKAASERAKRRWQNPSCRERMESGLKQLGKERQGQKMDKEFCRKVSEGLKKAYAEGRISRYEETKGSRQRRSETVRKLWEEGHYDEMLLKICRGPTDLELELAQALNKLELSHIPQYRPSGCPYIYDEYVPILDLLIETDGEHWHHSAWAESQGVPEKDARKDKWAAENGYHLVRLRGRDIRNFGIEACLPRYLFEQ